MSFWTWNRVVKALGRGATGPDRAIGGICTDSRQCVPGDLFVALSGEHFDGHDFLETARRQGAIAALVERQVEAGFDSGYVLRVDSTLAALALLAKAQRLALGPTLTAVTGSNGKTTVKEMLASMLRAEAERTGYGQVWATPGNFNNAIGVPLTLFGLQPEHRWAVIEMGMNHAGEIAVLSEMAQPDVAVITNIQRAHLGFLGSLQHIASAKAEIFSGLKPDGVAVIPMDHDFLPLLLKAAEGHRKLTFGFDARADVCGEAERGLLKMTHGGAVLTVRLQVPGTHNQLNALAATACALALEVGLSSIKAGLESFVGVKGRLQACFSPLGALILDDTYNANPDSVRAALHVLAAREGRKILVLGDLGELGDHAQQLHAELGHEARALGIDECYTVGELSELTSLAFGPTGHHDVHSEKLVARLRPQLNAQTVVLVKGSRFMKMEQIVKELVA